MNAQGFSVGTTPVLLLGPVDADYDVLITGAGSGSGGVFVGAANTITTSAGSGSYQLPACLPAGGQPPAELRLKKGDSLYAVAPVSSISVYIFAQPC